MKDENGSSFGLSTPGIITFKDIRMVFLLFFFLLNMRVLWDGSGAEIFHRVSRVTAYRVLVEISTSFLDLISNNILSTCSLCARHPHKRRCVVCQIIQKKPSNVFNLNRVLPGYLNFR